jgi:hypothetical protein
MGKPRRLRRRDSAEEVGGRRVERKLEVILLWVFESRSSVSHLLDSTFGTFKCDLVLNAPPDVAYESMQLGGADFILQRHPR